MEDEVETASKTENRFTWLTAADNVAEVARIPLLETFDLTITEFLNLMSYVIYKNKKLEEKYSK